MKKIIAIAVVGAKGFVGSGLCNALAKNPDYALVPVTRENYKAMQTGSYDVLINAAMPSGRFWAKSNPDADYRETVEKTEDLLKNWCAKKFIQISTVSARTEPESVYGRHKAEAERLCDPEKHLILRLSAMYSASLTKGVLIDILSHSKVYVSGESCYPFASLSFIADWICRNLDRTGLVELGAKNTVSLKEITDHLGEKIEFTGPVENQAIQNPGLDYPEARDVFKFIDSQRVTRK